MPPIMVVGIVLAAGASTRMGRPKALLAIGADTFVTRACRTLSEAGVDDLIVVAGTEHAAVAAALGDSGLHARVIENLLAQQQRMNQLPRSNPLPPLVFCSFIDRSIFYKIFIS